jgi:hypothetical protein
MFQKYHLVSLVQAFPTLGIIVPILCWLSHFWELFLQFVASFRTFGNRRSNLEQAFPNLGIVPPIWNKLSQTWELLLQLAGGF